MFESSPDCSSQAVPIIPAGDNIVWGFAMVENVVINLLKNGRLKLRYARRIRSLCYFLIWRC